MNDPVIRVENLSKRYIIGHQRARGEGLRHHLEEFARAPWRWLARRRTEARAQSEEFWALKDVSFEVKQGEVLGIIGRNGAGKSTLLKILSRITEPTAGRIEINGRVASLLEVGTGFHPELTGRENIFLNGAILGMARVEIKRKFDEIVAFAEIEKFLDTPVKRYSSGMYVRLAFAVAAHLEPEILVIDEVLAVGDAEFQRKCLGKMDAVSRTDGRTVLFVSHNMTAVQRLCQTCILLRDGKVALQGAASTVINEYIRDCGATTQMPLHALKGRTGTGAIRLTSFHLEDKAGHRVREVRSGSDFDIVLRYSCANPALRRKVDAGLSVHLPDETMIAVFYSSYTGIRWNSVSETGEFRCHIERLPLQEGTYLVGARIVAEGEEADWPRTMIGQIEVLGGDFYGGGTNGYTGSAPLLLSGRWSLR